MDYYIRQIENRYDADNELISGASQVTSTDHNFLQISSVEVEKTGLPF